MTDSFQGVLTKVVSKFKVNKKPEKVDEEKKEEENKENIVNDKIEVIDHKKNENGEIEINVQQEEKLD